MNENVLLVVKVLLSWGLISVGFGWLIATWFRAQRDADERDESRNSHG